MARILLAASVLVVAGWGGAAAAAPSYSFSLSPSALIGSASGTVHLDGTFTNNSGSRIYINGVENNSGAFSSYITAIDANGFFDTAPLYLDTGMSATFSVYDVIYAKAAAGLYPVFTSVTLVGGATDASQDFFDAGNLPTILIAGSIAPSVPEASSWALAIAGIGLAGAALRVSRRRFAFAA